MSEPDTGADATGSGALMCGVARTPWIIAGLFFGSGAVALIYEVIWFQLLRFSVGGSAVSLTVTLASFMGGLGLGAWLWPKLIPSSWHPLRVYAGLELGIAVLGAAMPWLIPAVSGLHAAWGGDTGRLLGRAVICALCLVPPAALMGATLPAVARWVSSTPSGVSWLGGFYALNTAGAVAGTLTSAFVLMPNLTMGGATAVAVVVNLAVAVAAWALSGRTPAVWGEAGVGGAAQEPQGAAASGGGRRITAAALVTIMLSGATAMGCQVVWTRALSMILSVTVYTFALILAGFLIGLALGGGLGAAVVKRTRRPGVMLALTQIAAVPAMAYAFWTIAHVVPEWDRPLRHVFRGMTARFGGDLLRVLVALLPATVCWGASMPLAIAAAGWGAAERGRLLGRVYGLNTLGAIGGIVLVGLVLIPQVGSDATAHVLVAVAGLAALVMAAASASSEPAATGVTAEDRVTLRIKTTPGQFVAWWSQVAPHAVNRIQRAAARPLGLVILLAALATAALFTPGVPPKLLLGKDAQHFDYTFIDFFEGMHAPVAVSTLPDGEKLLLVSGKVVASSIPADMRLQYMLGHIAALAHGQPRSVLIVGLGTGTTAGCFVDHPSIERIVICEIEPRVVDLARGYFSRENRAVLDDPRTELVFDDARHYLSHTDERFDIITSDPIHPWVKGASVLYSRDYYDLVQDRLNPGGVVSQWVPFYETGDDAVRTMLATFFDAFPRGSIWHTGQPGVGYDVVMLARPDAPRLDLREWADRWSLNGRVDAAFAEVEINEPIDLYTRFAGYAPQLADWLNGSTINRDHSLRLEYLAGLSRRLGTTAEHIYRRLIAFRLAPEALFDVAPDTLEKIRVWQRLEAEQSGVKLEASSP